MSAPATASGPSQQLSDPSTSSAPSRGRGRGSHKSRGGLGKYLRARGRGRGRGGGRPAEFHKRLVLEGEEEVEIDPESEEYQEFQKKYSRRQLGSNADRYAEPEPVLNSDGEIEEEPEVDLSAFLARQRLGDDGPSKPTIRPEEEEEDDDVDKALAANFPYNTSRGPKILKGKAQHIEWNDELEAMSREKAAADAQRDLKARFRANVTKQRSKPPVQSIRRDTKKDDRVEAPPLPTTGSTVPRNGKANMQDFLDDLLS